MGTEPQAIHSFKNTSRSPGPSVSTPHVAPTDQPASFWQQFKDCSSHRIERDVLGAALDSTLPAPQFASQAVEGLVKLTAPLVSASDSERRNYGHLFKVKDQKVMTPTLRTLLSQEGRMEVSLAREVNFAKVGFKPMPFSEYLRKVVVEDNVIGFREAFKQGQFFTGLLKLGWFGLGALPVFERTQNRWQQTHSKAETGKTLAKEATKAGVAWEIGRIGILLAERAFPIGWMAKLAGSIGLGLFSGISHTLLDKVWK